jgi:hypothetical protein
VKGLQFLLIIRRELCAREGLAAPAYCKT